MRILESGIVTQANENSRLQAEIEMLQKDRSAGQLAAAELDVYKSRLRECEVQ
jgi:hypothetical protein